MLAGQGYLVFEAQDAGAALDLIERQRPQLIISNAEVRPIGGVDLVRRIRARPDLAHTPVAFYVGARHEERTRAAAARVGIREILTSSTSPDAVLQSVRALLAQGGSATTRAADPPDRPIPKADPPADPQGTAHDVSPSITLTAVSARDLTRISGLAGVLTSVAGRLAAMIDAELVAIGYFDQTGDEGRVALSIDRAPRAGAGARWQVDRAALQDLHDRESMRWTPETHGADAAPIVFDGAPLSAVGVRLVSAGRPWAWLVAGRRSRAAFGERDERLAALLAAYASPIGDRLRGTDGLQGGEALLPMRELQAVCLNEVESLGWWEVDAALETLTCSDALAALVGRHGLQGSLRCEVALALLHPDDRDAVAEHLRRTVEEGVALDIECRYTPAEGAERTLQIVGGRLGGAPRPGAIVGLACDVTDRRRFEAQLLQAQRTSAMGLMAASVAHDFNNVLTAILGQARLLADDLANSHHRREMEQIHRTAERASELTRQLLVFSRTESAKPGIVGINDVIEDVMAMLGRLVGGHITLYTDLDADAPAVHMDRVQLEQVLLNLVVNARDAMPEGGRIDVRTTRVVLRGDERFKGEAVVAGVYAALSVADTGTGIDEHLRARIFDPFFTTKAHGAGTGLGLTTVSTVVKRSGGYLDVRSTVGKGTVFVVYLPGVERRAEATSSPARSPGPVALQGSRILVIEDETEVRQLVKAALERAGYEVVEAADTGEAEALIARLAGKLDLVIADVLIPGGTGPALFRRLADVRPSIRAIFMSGYSDESLEASGAVGPGTTFIQKPFTIDALLRAVRDALRQ
jgi:signal transduction histidine kinase/DNA-binding response OmpR family regulator